MKCKFCPSKEFVVKKRWGGLQIQTYCKYCDRVQKRLTAKQLKEISQKFYGRMRRATKKVKHHI